MTIEKVIQGWDGELVSSRFDRETGVFFTIAVHSRALGPAAGGTRAMHYTGADAAVEDATRLASAMTLKMAMANLPMGGGKSVMALPVARHEIDDRQWRRILEIHAENVATLGGNYWTGPDVGTASPDMDVLHEAGKYAFGRSEQAGGPGSSAPETAHGVYVSIHAAARAAGIDDLSGHRVLVQGLGAVGYDVATRLAEDGAELVVTDVDPSVCERAAGELDARVIGPDGVLTTPCDVFAPCAIGGVIDDEAARIIPTRVIAGAANNVLSTESASDELDRRGIVLAPDFVANGGGAIHLVGREILGWSPDEVADHVELIGHTLETVFAYASDEGISTDRAARRLAQERLDQS